MSERITEDEILAWRAGSKLTTMHPTVCIPSTEEELRWVIHQDACMILRLLDEVERLREENVELQKLNAFQARDLDKYLGVPADD